MKETNCAKFEVHACELIRINISINKISIYRQDGETLKRIEILTLDDETPEDDETLLVYIVPETSGVRVARPSTDNGRKVWKYSSYTNN